MTAPMPGAVANEPNSSGRGLGRALGVDLGSVRIGIALSDPTRTVASPLSVLRRAKNDHAADHRAILDLVREHEATTIVVGLPLSLSGGKGPAARAAVAEIAELQAAAAGIDVVAHDERLTTVSAERSLDEAGVRGRDRTAVVDKVAAAIMLQSWLESPRT